MELLEKIQKRNATVGVIGLGYVGLPLIIQFVKAGFKTIGFDIDVEKVKCLQEGKPYIRHIPVEEMRLLKGNGGFEATSNFSSLKEADCIIICVPTPLTKSRVGLALPGGLPTMPPSMKAAPAPRIVEPMRRAGPGDHSAPLRRRVGEAHVEALVEHDDRGSEELEAGEGSAHAPAWAGRARRPLSSCRGW